MQAIPIKDLRSDERVPIEMVQRQAASVVSGPTSKALLSSALNYVLILNQQRQIIYASKNFLHLAGTPDLDSILGQRPGEALNCQHAVEKKMRCGISDYCEECGVVKAILESLAGRQSLQEGRLMRLINCAPAALDLLVYATPFVHGGETFSIVTIADVSHQNRRRALEKIFFNDVINSAGNLAGLAGLLRSRAPDHMTADLVVMENALKNLLEDIAAQKDLAAAENNELKLAPTFLKSEEILADLVRLFQAHDLAKGKKLAISKTSESMVFYSDGVLLRRVLGNLVKNALEASAPGETILLGAHKQGAAAEICFRVHNPGLMPREVQLKVFARSFSTKGTGRGLGTYSAKLLTEKYLHGNVEFRSALELGTEFIVRIPEALGAQVR
jgi:hypothetical protein